MQWHRLWRNLVYPAWRTRRLFPARALEQLQTAICQSEQGHRGEIRLVIEGSLSIRQLWQDLSPRQRALQLFAEYGVWDTDANTGVLIYLLLAERRLEIIADRGINARVDQAQWDGVRDGMRDLLGRGHYGPALQHGLLAITRLLDQHFPADSSHNPDELPNQPVLLD